VSSFSVENCSDYDDGVIEEWAYAGGRAVWTACNETNEMSCWLRTASLGRARPVELAAYCCSYAFTSFVPVGGGGLIVYRKQASGQLLQILPSGKQLPLAVPPSLRGARPVATDGTRIALFAHKILYLVDRRGHVVAQWPSPREPDVVFAGDRLVTALRPGLIVRDLRTGESSGVELTPPGADWTHSLADGSGDLVAYVWNRQAKDENDPAQEQVVRHRIELVRLTDHRSATVAEGGGPVSATFGATLRRLLNRR